MSTLKLNANAAVFQPRGDPPAAPAPAPARWDDEGAPPPSVRRNWDDDEDDGARRRPVQASIPTPKGPAKVVSISAKSAPAAKGPAKVISLSAKAPAPTAKSPAPKAVIAEKAKEPETAAAAPSAEADSPVASAAPAAASDVAAVPSPSPAPVDTVDDECGDEGEAPVIPDDQIAEEADGSDLPPEGHLNVVFIGHVDAGKSTICGQILVQSRQLDERELEKMERMAAKRAGASWAFAYAMDLTDYERDKGKTQEIGSATFATAKRHFTILDAPGHRNFISHMICGAAQADVGVLVLSARQGEFEAGFDRGGQTKEHAMLAKTAGVDRLIVVVNKMDDPTVNWSETRFNLCRDQATAFLKTVGFTKKDMIFLPMSGFTGANMVAPVGDTCPWYTGPTFFQLLDDVPEPKRPSAEGPVRMTCMNSFKEMGTTMVIGRLDSGTICMGDNIVVMPSREEALVTNIWVDSGGVNEGKPIRRGKAGDSLRLGLRGLRDTVSMGSVICDRAHPVQVAKAFEAEVMVVEAKTLLCAGYTAVMHTHGCEEEVEFKELLALKEGKKEKGADGERRRPAKPRFAKKGATVTAVLTLPRSIAVETFKVFKPLGRFVIRDEELTIGVGIVTKVIE